MCCFLVSLHLSAVESVYGMVGHDDNALLLVFTAKGANPVLQQIQCVYLRRFPFTVITLIAVTHLYTLQIVCVI